MSAPLSDAQINAYLDGELSPEARLAVEQAAGQHPEIAERLRQERAVLDALAASYGPLMDEQVPARLLNAGAPKPWPWLHRVAAAAACAGLGAVIGWQAGSIHSLSRLAASRPVSLEAAAAHAVYTPEVRHAVEVVSSERDHLNRWLSKRLAHKLVAPDLTAYGFDLVGGRLLSDTGRPAAQYMYQNTAGDRVTLYVRPEPGARSPTALHMEEDQGFRVVHWEDHEMAYAVTGSLDGDLLMRVASTVHEQL